MEIIIGIAKTLSYILAVAVLAISLSNKFGIRHAFCISAGFGLLLMMTR